MTNDRSLAAAIMAFIRALIASIFGGVREAGASLYGDVKKVAGFTKAAVDRTTAAVGAALEGPARALDLTASAVGGFLGSMLPRPAVHAADVAEAALANDNRASAGPRPVAMGLGELVIAHNKAAMDPSGRSGRDLQPLPRDVANWLSALDVGARCTLAFVPAGRVEEHLRAETLMQVHGGLPLMPRLRARLDAEAPQRYRAEDYEADDRRIMEAAYKILETPEAHARVAAFRM
ncbi:hypothetical protein [Methylobacterium sp. 37f]|uniref:hypothetical protein n=1 Tax=Methylobacterium sp. 37f TaxID=2817058 RepID=UPI001FFD31A8|nr:hypothetical protein [Methylobacterium sp. 37f]MCK2055305.1 hypothetical protein [Methylobacterium sp. 37f]